MNQPPPYRWAAAGARAPPFFKTAAAGGWNTRATGVANLFCGRAAAAVGGAAADEDKPRSRLSACSLPSKNRLQSALDTAVLPSCSPASGSFFASVSTPLAAAPLRVAAAAAGSAAGSSFATAAVAASAGATSAREPPEAADAAAFSSRACVPSAATAATAALDTAAALPPPWNFEVPATYAAVAAAAAKRQSELGTLARSASMRFRERLAASSSHLSTAAPAAATAAATAPAALARAVSLPQEAPAVAAASTVTPAAQGAAFRNAVRPAASTVAGLSVADNCCYLPAARVAGVASSRPSLLPPQGRTYGVCAAPTLRLSAAAAAPPSYRSWPRRRVLDCCSAAAAPRTATPGQFCCRASPAFCMLPAGTAAATCAAVAVHRGRPERGRSCSLAGSETGKQRAATVPPKTTGVPLLAASLARAAVASVPAVVLAESRASGGAFPAAAAASPPAVSSSPPFLPAAAKAPPPAAAASSSAAAAAAAGCPGLRLPLLRLSPVRLAKTGPSRGRGPLLAKFAPKGFKKGFGAVGLGRHTKKGFFIINTMLVPSFKVPDLSDCKLKCYVSPKAFRVVQQGFLNRSAPGYQEEKSGA